MLKRHNALRVVSITFVVMGVLLIGGALLFYPVQCCGLTAYELIAFAIISAWIAIFIRSINALAAAPAPDAALEPQQATA